MAVVARPWSWAATHHPHHHPTPAIHQPPPARVSLTIPTILDVVVAAAGQHAGNFSPPVAQFGPHPHDQLFFLFRPRDFFQFRVKMVVPAFPALFPDSSGQKTSNETPLGPSVLLHQVLQRFVLLGRPGPLAFDDGWVQDVAPMRHALFLGFLAPDGVDDFHPVFGFMYIDGDLQRVRFFLGPRAGRSIAGRREVGRFLGLSFAGRGRGGGWGVGSVFFSSGGGRVGGTVGFMGVQGSDDGEKRVERGNHSGHEEWGSGVVVGERNKLIEAGPW